MLRPLWLLDLTCRLLGHKYRSWWEGAYSPTTCRRCGVSKADQ